MSTYDDYFDYFLMEAIDAQSCTACDANNEKRSFFVKKIMIGNKKISFPISNCLYGIDLNIY